MSWSDVQSKPMGIKAKHKDRNKINRALKGQNSFLSPGEHLGKGEGLCSKPEMEQNKAGLWPHLTGRQDGVAHEDRWTVLKFLLCLLLSG